MEFESESRSVEGEEYGVDDIGLYVERSTSRVNSDSN
jgi:hypothetical protein